MSRVTATPALLVGLAALAMGPGPAVAGMADRIGITFTFIAEDFIKAARPLDGMVVSAEGDRVYLDVGEEAGAQVGQELMVFRRGEPFHHPISGRVLGRYEDVLGHAQIQRVEPRFSEARFIPAPDAAAPRPEDGVRISRARLPVAITPVMDLTASGADVRRVPYLLASVLERSKRFQVVDPLAVNDMFATNGLRVEEVLARPERAVRIARNLEVSGWLVPLLLERRGIVYLDVTWISAVTGTALFSRRLPLTAGGTAEGQRFPWEPRPED
jgi:hypothetical protein